MHNVYVMLQQNLLFPGRLGRGISESEGKRFFEAYFVVLNVCETWLIFISRQNILVLYIFVIDLFALLHLRVVEI